MARTATWDESTPWKEVVTKFTVDLDKKSVESTALLEWGSRAHFDSAKFGCVIDD